MKTQNNGLIIGQRGEMLFSKDTALAFAAENINSGNHLQSSVSKRITPDFKAAEETIEQMVDRLEETNGRMNKAMDALAKGATDASRKARSSAADMTAMLDKINRGTNYERLERNVALLERTATAMQALAELEKSGHLARVMKALQP